MINVLLAKLGETYFNFIKGINIFAQRRKCFICGKTFFSFLPVFGDDWYDKQMRKYGVNWHFNDMTYNKWEYRCPCCGAIDRTRLIMMYIQKHYKRRQDVKLLYFAPTAAGISFLKSKMKGWQIDTNDLYRKDVDYHMDIQNMKGVQDNFYDVLICSHVLEHVEDDECALKELYRVMKPGGSALILVPLDLKRSWFDEGKGLGENEKWKRFGQADHVRRYTDAELRKKIRNAGFICKVFSPDALSGKLRRENAFNRNIRIYVAQRSEGNELCEN